MSDKEMNMEEFAKQQLQENKMGVMPVNKLLVGMSLPMMISMMVLALYNVVDSIFVSRLGEEALTAVALAFPMQMITVAVGAGTGIGVNAVLSRALGQKNQKKVNEAAENGIFLAVISYLVFFVLGLTISNPFIQSQSENAVTIGYGVSYLTICLTFSAGMMIQMIFEKLLQSTGKTIYIMITQATGALINIILDPILIFGWFGMPKMDVAGAAIATVAGQFAAGILAVFFHFKVNKEVQVKLKGYRPNLKIIGTIYTVGFPSIIMQSIGSVMTYGMNRILGGFTETATAVFGVYFKLQSFIFMPVFGLTNGVVPIVAYNYGAHKKKRMLSSIKLAMVYSISVMVIGLLIFQIFPKILLGFFDASPEMLAIGTVALRTISLSFVVAGFCIICGTVFQALGNGVYSMVVSIARQLIILLPSAYLLSRSGNLDMVWWAFPIAEGMSLFVTLFFVFRISKRIIKKIPEEA